jgi:hypothetical protein
MSSPWLVIKLLPQGATLHVGYPVLEGRRDGGFGANDLFFTLVCYHACLEKGIFGKRVVGEF